MNKLTRIALAVALMAANGIAATNASAARGVSIGHFGHGFAGGRYFPPEPTMRRYYPPRDSALSALPHASRRHARVIPAHPPSVSGYTGPNGPTCHTVSIHAAPNCVAAGGTLVGGYVANGVHIMPYCVLCD